MAVGSWVRQPRLAFFVDVDNEESRACNAAFFNRFQHLVPDSKEQSDAYYTTGNLPPRGTKDGT